MIPVVFVAIEDVLTGDVFEILEDRVESFFDSFERPYHLVVLG